MVPSPVQAAARAALADDGHVLAQRSRYGHRRELLQDALDGAGFQVSAEAGLYLWCTRGESGHGLGRLVRRSRHPGRPRNRVRTGGANFVRVALTAADQQVSAAADRLKKWTGRR